MAKSVTLCLHILPVLLLLSLILVRDKIYRLSGTEKHSQNWSKPSSGAVHGKAMRNFGNTYGAGKGSQAKMLSVTNKFKMVHERAVIRRHASVWILIFVAFSKPEVISTMPYHAEAAV